VNKKISPIWSVLVVLAAVGAIFAVMWYQSEAPKWNRLPEVMPMRIPTAAAKKTPAVKPKPSSRQSPTSEGAHATEKAKTSEAGDKDAHK